MSILEVQIYHKNIVIPVLYNTETKGLSVGVKGLEQLTGLRFSDFMHGCFLDNTAVIKRVTLADANRFFELTGKPQLIDWLRRNLEDEIPALNVTVPPYALKEQATQSTELVVCDTAVRRDADGRYCLNDLHRASGGERKHETANWLNNAQTKELIDELSNTGIPVFTTRGRNGGTFVVKELVYAYAMWISPQFSLKVIRAYDALVTGTINPVQMLNDPATMRGLLLTYCDKVQVLEHQCDVAKEVIKMQSPEITRTANEATRLRNKLENANKSKRDLEGQNRHLKDLVNEYEHKLAASAHHEPKRKVQWMSVRDWGMVRLGKMLPNVAAQKLGSYATWECRRSNHEIGRQGTANPLQSVNTYPEFVLDEIYSGNKYIRGLCGNSLLETGLVH